jgi:hypothetical protein
LKNTLAFEKLCDTIEAGKVDLNHAVSFRETSGAWGIDITDSRFEVSKVPFCVDGIEAYFGHV